MKRALILVLNSEISECYYEMSFKVDLILLYWYVISTYVVICRRILNNKQASVS